MIKYDPANTPDSPVYFCEMSGVKIVFLKYALDSLTSDNCLVHIFLIAIFSPNGEHNETVRCTSFYFTKIHRTYFRSEALCPV